MTDTTPTPFQLTSRLGDRVIGQEQLSDPFLRHTIKIGRLDLQRGIRAGELVITVHLDAEQPVVSTVMRALRGDGSCCAPLVDEPTAIGGPG